MKYTVPTSDNVTKPQARVNHYLFLNQISDPNGPWAGLQSKPRALRLLIQITALIQITGPNAGSCLLRRPRYLSRTEYSRHLQFLEKEEYIVRERVGTRWRIGITDRVPVSLGQAPTGTNYVKLYRSPGFWEDLEQGGNVALLWLWILSRTQGLDENMSLSFLELSKHPGLSRQEVRTALAKLRKLGLVLYSERFNTKRVREWLEENGTRCAADQAMLRMDGRRDRKSSVVICSKLGIYEEQTPYREEENTTTKHKTCALPNHVSTIPDLNTSPDSTSPEKDTPPNPPAQVEEGGGFENWLRNKLLQHVRVYRNASPALQERMEYYYQNRFEHGSRGVNWVQENRRWNSSWSCPGSEGDLIKVLDAMDKFGRWSIPWDYMQDHARLRTLIRNYPDPANKGMQKLLGEAMTMRCARAGYWVEIQSYLTFYGPDMIGNVTRILNESSPLIQPHDRESPLLLLIGLHLHMGPDAIKELIDSQAVDWTLYHEDVIRTARYLSTLEPDQLQYQAQIYRDWDIEVGALEFSLKNEYERLRVPVPVD